jgi:(E)-4-hydroxy-3-methylbut-2-enyl-diphosphate synthase
MTKTDTRDYRATINQIKELQDYGCDIIRMAVPDDEAARSLATIKKAVTLPVIADIHFDYRLALAALSAGVDGLRLNPGNIRDKGQINAVVKAARKQKTPIRIGVNAGSLPPGRRKGASVAGYMVSTAMEQVRLLEDMDFELIKIALKAFDVPTTVSAYRQIARLTDYPLHIGITESGLPQAGLVRSAAGIGILLDSGIGDTIRVSLTSHPRDEVIAGYEILKSLNLREHGPVLVSCPTCGRCEADIFDLAGRVNIVLGSIKQPLKVAVMGCVVNGPGEARDADTGIACGKGRGVIFRKGKIVRTVEQSDYFESLMNEITEAARTIT